MRQLTAEQRAKVNAARAEIASIMNPLDKEAKARRRAERRAMVARIGKRRAGQRQPRERDPGFLAWLRRLPCIAGVMGRTDCEGAVQAAHVRFSAHGKGRNPGLGSKNHDRHANPLCAFHHLQDQHTRSEIAFWADLGVDAYDLSAALYAAYQAGEDGLAVLRRFSPSNPHQYGEA